MPQPIANRVLLVGWDAADWKIIHPLLDAGRMPNLARLVERGTMGNLATLEPAMSPLLWTSIATGKTADLHGIHGFVEPDPATGGARPVASTSRKAKALWNILHQSGRRSIAVNWFGSHPAEPVAGAVVSNAFCQAGIPYGAPWPLPSGTIHPQEYSAEMAELRVHPGDLTGDDLLPFLPKLAEIDQESDARVIRFAEILAQNLSAHNAMVWLMEREAWDFATVFYDLPDHVSHLFMRYRAPRMEDVPERDFEHYRHAVDSAYCYLDILLGRLVQLAGPEAAVMVVSDHGFHSDHQRGLGGFTPDHEEPMQWHRMHGMLCMAGPGIRHDELVYGATLLDIAPTVLMLFGLPAGADMQGRVLAEAFDGEVPLDRIASWEDEPGDAGMHPPDARGDVWDSAAMMKQLVALGYLEAPAEGAEEQLKQVRTHQAFSLARVYLARKRPADALPLMEEAVAAYPDEATYRIYLAQCYYETGRMEDCRRVVEGVLERGGDWPAAQVLRANLLLAEGRTEEGLAALLAAERSQKPAQGIRLVIGQVHLHLQRWADAERAFRSTLEWDSDLPAAYAGLAQALLRQNRFDEAAEAATDALARRFDLPEAHFTLGAALVRLKRYERAEQAFETCAGLTAESDRYGAAAREWLQRLQKARGYAGVR
ncbi:MAG TPA: alkaline phosphatase family protein [Bryobacteraceae bacterium]|nr:alkaline phosphatase family protein [Bryobacteraceae bacterium]